MARLAANRPSAHAGSAESVLLPAAAKLRAQLRQVEGHTAEDSLDARVRMTLPKVFAAVVSGGDDDVDDESNFQYIPFAPTMFPKMIPEDKILFIDPPAGLLKGRLGQGDVFDVEGDSLDDSELKEALDKLKFDLMPYARTLGDNHYGMPSKRALEKENKLQEMLK